MNDAGEQLETVRSAMCDARPGKLNLKGEGRQTVISAIAALLD
jgi:hypothetical protein